MCATLDGATVQVVRSRSNFRTSASICHPRGVAVDFDMKFNMFELGFFLVWKSWNGPWDFKVILSGRLELMRFLTFTKFTMHLTLVVVVDFVRICRFCTLFGKGTKVCSPYYDDCHNRHWRHFNFPVIMPHLIWLWVAFVGQVKSRSNWLNHFPLPK